MNATSTIFRPAPHSLRLLRHLRASKASHRNAISPPLPQRSQKRHYQPPSYRQQTSIDYINLFASTKPTDLKGIPVWRAIPDYAQVLLERHPTSSLPPTYPAFYFQPPRLLPIDQPTWYQAHKQVAEFVAQSDVSKMTQQESSAFSRQLQSLQGSAKIFINTTGKNSLPEFITKSRTVWQPKMSTTTPAPFSPRDYLMYSWKAWNPLPEPHGGITESFQMLFPSSYHGGRVWSSNTAQFPLAPVLQAFNLDSFVPFYRSQVEKERARALQFYLNTKTRNYNIATALFVHRRNALNERRHRQYGLHRPIALFRLVMIAHLVMFLAVMIGVDWISINGAPLTITLQKRGIALYNKFNISVPPNNVIFQYAPEESKAEIRARQKQRQLDEKRYTLRLKQRQEDGYIDSTQDQATSGVLDIFVDNLTDKAQNLHQSVVSQVEEVKSPAETKPTRPQTRAEQHFSAVPSKYTRL